MAAHTTITVIGVKKPNGPTTVPVRVFGAARTRVISTVESISGTGTLVCCWGRLAQLRHTVPFEDWLASYLLKMKVD